jgi:hypothetical protein
MLEALIDDGYTFDEAVAELRRNGRPKPRPPKRPRLADHERARRVAREMAFLQGIRWSEMADEGRAAVTSLAELAIRAVERVDEATARRASGKAGPW